MQRERESAQRWNEREFMSYCYCERACSFVCSYISGEDQNAEQVERSLVALLALLEGTVRHWDTRERVNERKNERTNERTSDWYWSMYVI